MRNSRQQKKTKGTATSERYDEIVRIAGDLFAERGFDGTSLHDLAAEVGVLKGSLYHWIDSKESLLYDVIKLSHGGLQENMQIADRFANDPVRQLTAFAYGHIVLNAVPERLNRGIVFVHDSRKLAPDDAERVLQDRDRYDQYLRAIITRGMASGAFDASSDPRLCAFAVLGTITSYLRWFKPGGPVSPEHLGREFCAFILAAVAPKLVTEGPRYSLVDEVSPVVNELIAEIRNAG